MYRFYIKNIDNDYHYSELIRVFIPDSDFEVIMLDASENRNLCLGDKSFIVNKSNSPDRDTIKKELFLLLKEITGMDSEWGTLTGVRPLKIALKQYEKLGSIDAMRDVLDKTFVLSRGKIDLLSEIAEYQLDHVTDEPMGKTGIYIGIPFCPTRCAYCSFASNVANIHEIDKYFANLLTEIKYMAKLFRDNDGVCESVYIGGGTPTTLSAEQLKELITLTISEFNIDINKIEFSVEAGRPDTIDKDKLLALKELGIRRISINPQTMKDETLKLIGRKHSSDEIVKAYELANEVGFEIINADIIAGLPKESLDDFKDTINKVIDLGPNNITVHTLSVKRGSRLIDEDPEYYRKNVETVSKMLEYSHEVLKENGFYPYYIYKQKHQIGAFENVGYCKADTHSIYNIRIMEEKQTIIGLGAGAVGKRYFPAEDRLERVSNVSNYEIYNERFDEMLDRKNSYYGGNDGN